MIASHLLILRRSECRFVSRLASSGWQNGFVGLDRFAEGLGIKTGPRQNPVRGAEYGRGNVRVKTL